MKITIMECMKKTVEANAEKPALVEKIKGQWHAITWEAYYRQVRTAARAFMALGLEPGKSVGILGNNCTAWFISNLASIFAGGIPTGIYQTSSPEQCHYIAENSRANILVVEDADQLTKIKQIRHRLPDLKALVMMKGSDDDESVYSWEQLSMIAQRISEKELEARIQAQTPDDCCTLIYTSGTTGNPKGVMISHDNITWTSARLLETIGGSPDDVIASYLPLSHIAEQIISLHSPISMGATTWFAESLDRLGENLLEIRPTVFIGVPRVWEKIQSKIMTIDETNSWLKRKITAWARKIGLAAGYAHQEGKAMPLLYTISDKLVFSKVKQKLGLDRCRLFVATAAPTSQDTLEFFMSLGILVTEVYGQSECTGPTVISLPKPHHYRTGWCGPALKGTALSIADDGEILIKGRHVFLGYLNNEKATREAIDENKWLHSGDVGIIDDYGFLKVTDRKKELIITSGGENIAPQMIEGKLRAIPVISQAVVIGNNRKYLSALITLDEEKIPAAAKLAGSSAKDIPSAASCNKFTAYLEQQIDAVNQTLARVQTIKKYTILPAPFTVEGGEITHTMKIKRKIIQEKYIAQIEGMYTAHTGQEKPFAYPGVTSINN